MIKMCCQIGTHCRKTYNAVRTKSASSAWIPCATLHCPAATRASAVCAWSASAMSARRTSTAPTAALDCPRTDCCRRRGSECEIGPTRSTTTLSPVIGDDEQVCAADPRGPHCTAGSVQTLATGATSCIVTARQSGFIVRKRTNPCSRCAHHTVHLRCVENNSASPW